MNRDFEFGIKKQLITKEELQKKVKELGVKITEDFKNAASLNEYDKLENFFLPTLKNKYVVKQLKQYNLSNFVQ